MFEPADRGGEVGELGVGEVEDCEVRDGPELEGGMEGGREGEREGGGRKGGREGGL